jgi:sensory rhodopsin
MVFDISTTYAIGTVSMIIGTLALLVGLRSRASEYPWRYVALAGVTGIAAIAYAAMTAGIGSVTVGDSTVFVPRYLDWLATTPLLLLYIGLLAGALRRTVATAVALDIVVIGFGLAATLSTSGMRYALFGIASLAFVGVLYYIYRPMTRAARERDRNDAALFLKLRNVIGVLWLLYPVIWLVGPPGLGLMRVEMTAIIVVYLDVLTKVIFGAIVLNDRGTFAPGGTRNVTTERDRAASSGSEAD